MGTHEAQWYAKRPADARGAYSAAVRCAVRCAAAGCALYRNGAAPGIFGSAAPVRFTPYFAWRFLPARSETATPVAMPAFTRSQTMKGAQATAKAAAGSIWPTTTRCAQPKK